MNALFLLKLIHLEQVGIGFVVAVGLESIKAELFVRARRSRGDASSLEALDQSRFQAFRLQLLILSLTVFWYWKMPSINVGLGGYQAGMVGIGCSASVASPHALT